MFIKGKKEFVNLVKSFNIQSEYVVVKPNWVDNVVGNYTEPEILEWLFESLNKQKKIVIESYTPWRGLKYEPRDDLKTDLEEGKNFWDFYKKQDEYYLKETGTNKILKKFNADYINITDEYWKGEIVDPNFIKDIVKTDLFWTELYSYIPQRLFDIRKKATFISLAKIKIEEGNKDIVVSLSLKNIFGLIPSPSRKEPYHKDNHSLIPQAIVDINKIYQTLFPDSLWINEGIFSLVKNYCTDNQAYIKNSKLVFIGNNGIDVDTSTCNQMGIDSKSVPYLN